LQLTQRYIELSWCKESRQSRTPGEKTSLKRKRAVLIEEIDKPNNQISALIICCNSWGLEVVVVIPKEVTNKGNGLGFGGKMSFANDYCFLISS
jgi:hypothetical protein